CYAIAEPQAASRRGERPFAAILFWSDGGAHGQLHVRLAAPKRKASAILLRVDGQIFQLVGGGANAWAPDSAADQRIVAAMRRGAVMTVTTRSEQGLALRDRYRLRGAATAIDAAALACAPRR